MKNFTQSSHINQKKFDRYQFMKLSMEERKRVLEEQAGKMLKPYEENREWQEVEIDDLIDG